MHCLEYFKRKYTEQSPFLKEEHCRKTLHEMSFSPALKKIKYMYLPNAYSTCSPIQHEHLNSLGPVD